MPAYSGRIDRPGELCYNCSISNDFIQMVNFPTWIAGCDSQSPDSFGFISFPCKKINHVPDKPILTNV